MRYLKTTILMTVCLIPLAIAGWDGAIVSPWHRAELEACAGDFVLPSGLYLRVRHMNNALYAGAAEWRMRRVTPLFYRGAKKPFHLRFYRSALGDVQSVELSGSSPAVRARRATKADSDTAQIVNVAGSTLRLNIAGRTHSGPTVILETGPLGGMEGLSQCQADIAEFARVVAYDHPGTGGSGPGPTPQTAAAVLTRLRKALSELAIEPPYIVVGISMGGPYSQVFAHHNPKDVCGLVWVDPTPDWDRLHEWCERHAPKMQTKIQRSRQWLDLSIASGMRDSQETGRKDEWAAMATTWEQVRNAVLPDIPIVQVTGAEDYELDEGVRMKVDYFTAVLEESFPNHRHVLALESGHGIYATEPGLVLDAIRSLIAATRAHVDLR